MTYVQYCTKILQKKSNVYQPQRNNIHQLYNTAVTISIRNSELTSGQRL